MTKLPASPGRVSHVQKFKPAVKKRRLIRAPETSEPTEEALRTVAAGAWLKGLREARGLSQRDLAAALEMKHYARISQMESGKIHLQPHLFEQAARALGQEPKAFVIKLLSYYAPETFSILFGDGQLPPDAK